MTSLDLGSVDLEKKRAFEMQAAGVDPRSAVFSQSVGGGPSITQGGGGVPDSQVLLSTNQPPLSPPAAAPEAAARVTPDVLKEHFAEKKIREAEVKAGKPLPPDIREKAKAQAKGGRWGDFTLFLAAAGDALSGQSGRGVLNQIVAQRSEESERRELQDPRSEISMHSQSLIKRLFPSMKGVENMTAWGLRSTMPQYFELAKMEMARRAASDNMASRQSSAMRGKELSQNTIREFADQKSALNMAENLKGELKKYESVMGPVGGTVRSLNPWNKDAKQFDAYSTMVKQIIGKGLEGGVLRKEDEYKYKKILPTIQDTPEIATAKVDQLQRELAEKYATNYETFGNAGYDMTGLEYIASKTEDRYVVEMGGRRYVVVGSENLKKAIDDGAERVE